MSRSIAFKLITSFILLVLCLWNVFPLKDIPFYDFLKKQPSTPTFSEVLNDAQKRVQTGSEPSLFVSLSHLAQERNLDLAQYFPKINLADIKNLQKRNDILLRHLFNKSLSNIRLGLDLQGGVAFTLSIDDSAIKDKDQHLQQMQLSKAIDIMDKRINSLGVSEPIIRAKGNSSLEIQLPGLTTQENPDALRSLQKPAKLTFHKVHRTLFPDSTAASDFPIGYIPMPLESTNPITGEIHSSQLFIKQIPELSGSSIKSAFATMNDAGAYEIALNLTDKGTKRFADVTGAIALENQSYPYVNFPDNHPGRFGCLAIVLDGKLYSAPRVQEAITTGHARISGNFSQREALELANVLNNPLEFELKLDEMYEVGPSLAKDARSAAIKASVVGAGLVILFMVVYYLSAGFIAVIAVALNIIIILGILASLHFTLTLPGIAALVLTVGMAVDSNILIFERIREELKSGKSLLHAIEAGHHRAFATILDANLTTLLTAAILIWLGTGPIKGFGVTLAIGIGATLFCALVTSHALLELFAKANIIKKFITLSLFKESSFDIMKWRKPAFIATWSIVLIGFIAIGIKNKHVLGTDFLGGDELTLSFSQKIDTQDINKTLSKANLGEHSSAYQKLISGHSQNPEVLKIQAEHGQGKIIASTLKKAFPQANFSVIGENNIGASVSNAIVYNAFLSVALAILGILIYIAFRFETGFGVGAFISTIHDVLISIGIYVLLGGQFSAPMVASILMIIGYSINDTIVVFDRIREELKLNPTLNLYQVINLSINKTFSRTILTSFTTLLSALALYLFGTGIVVDFSLVFIIGIITGTFSSIFVASPIFYWWHKGDRHHLESKNAQPTKSYSWDSSHSSKN